MTENPASRMDFRAARDAHRELREVAARCRNQRVAVLREYIASGNNRLERARADAAAIPREIEANQRELSALESMSEADLLALVATAEATP